MSALEKSDPQTAAAVQAERKRQAETLEMIASENHASAAVLEAMGSALTDKYAEGYPGRRWYCGCENMDTVERLAIERANVLFGSEHANVQPHSGTTANLSVYLAALKPGEKIMGMRLDQGGHLSHGLDINLSGICYKSASYGVDPTTETLDMEEIRRQVLKERPAILVVGASAYPRTIDFAEFGRIAHEASCMMLSDIAHIAGLVVGDVHPDPVPHSEFVTTTTHKTLRGPRGGVILCRKEWAKAIDAAVFPGYQGGPLMHVIAAKAIAFREASGPEFKKYAAAVVANAAALAEAVAERGWRLVSGGTDNHLLLIDLRSRTADLNGHDAARMLAAAGIVANKNKIPFDPRPAAESSGIRLGTPALTTRGMGVEQMRLIAGWIDDILLANGQQSVIENIRAKVLELCRKFPIPNSNHH
jgi:glycine hydroxymethyltransferase